MVDQKKQAFGVGEYGVGKREVRGAAQLVGRHTSRIRAKSARGDELAQVLPAGLVLHQADHAPRSSRGVRDLSTQQRPRHRDTVAPCALPSLRELDKPRNRVHVAERQAREPQLAAAPQ